MVKNVTVTAIIMPKIPKIGLPALIFFTIFNINPFTVIFFPDPILIILPITFLLLKHLWIAFTASDIYIKSFPWVPLEQLNFSSFKDMGKLMNILKSEYPGVIDMGVAGKIAKIKLGK